MDRIEIQFLLAVLLAVLPVRLEVYQLLPN